MPKTKIPDSDWILAGADGAAAGLIKKVIRNQVQRKILSEFSAEERAKGHGFACKVIIEGEDGGIFLLCFSKEEGLQPKPPDVAIRNTVFADEDTLISLVTFDLSQLCVVKPDGNELTGLEAFVWMIDNGYQDKLPEFKTITTISEAYANQRIKFAGDVPNVDMVEWQRIYDRALNQYAIPMIKDIMVNGHRKSKEIKEDGHQS